jgi:hypothetical protein
MVSHRICAPHGPQGDKCLTDMIDAAVQVMRIAMGKMPGRTLPNGNIAITAP